MGTPVSSINKTDRHDITEILLKAKSNTITQGSHCQSPMSQFAIFFLDWRLKSASGDCFGA
jgi:hypothetical protein